MANTYLQRTLGTPTSAYKGTLSWWQKGASTNSTQYILACESGSERFLWYISSGSFGGGLRGTSSPPDIDFSLSGTPKFRDVSNWYNFVLSWDSTQSTASDRIKFYVNNVQYAVSSSGTSGVNDIPLNHVMPMNKSGLPFRLGSNITGGNYFTGLMSHIHLIDGTAYDATAFGETDATTGEWKIKTSPSVTYGTNGFFILKDGNSVTDQSGNSNNFTVGGGTLTKTEDSPSNVFATFNPLLDVNAKPTLSNGNTTMAGAAISSAQFAGSTICVSNGKWYFEAKVTPNSSSPYVGVIDAQSTLRKNANYFVHTASGTNQSGYAVNMSGDIYHNNSNSYAANIGSISSGDILGFAIDLDSAQRTCEIYKNGASQRSFNLDEPTSGAYMLGCCSSYNTASASVNFGNGYFGTTAVSSAGTNASGNGIFEYDVPTGYTALSTKGLNT